MKAVTFQGPLKVEVKDMPDPTIQDPNDVILKVTTAGICGSDVHAYDGRMNIPATGWSMGHEYIGEVVEVGGNVKNFKKGDRAVGSFVSSCGECYYCTTGWPSQCAKQQFFGFIILGGAQAEYLRVPNGHYTLEKVPDGISDEKAIFTGDIFSTGYFCADRGEIKPNDVVAVVGSGPVGLFAQMSALMFEPKVVLAIDSMPERLEMSKRIGAVPVDMSKVDPVGRRQGALRGPRRRRRPRGRRHRAVARVLLPLRAPGRHDQRRRHVHRARVPLPDVPVVPARHLLQDRRLPRQALHGQPPRPDRRTARWTPR